METNSNETNPTSENFDIVKLSKNAVLEVKRRLAEEQTPQTPPRSQASTPTEMGLRLGVKGGGCSGLSYVIDLGPAKTNDHVSMRYGFPLFIDPKSGLYLKDTELDYEGGFMGSGFKFKNPNVSNTCGCGESFSL